MTEPTIYDQAGGEATIRKMVEHFYALVEADPVLRPLFPEDLTPGKHWQFLFLSQLFGGPGQYNEERGHPRLRMRHFPFKIDQQARDHWLDHMLTAIDAAGVPEPARTEMRSYFDRSSTFLINSESESQPENLMQWRRE